MSTTEKCLNLTQFLLGEKMRIQPSRRGGWIYPFKKFDRFKKVFISKIKVWKLFV